MSWLDEIRSVMKNPLKRLNMCLWGNIYSDWLQADRILANDLLLVKLSPHTHTHTHTHTHSHTPSPGTSLGSALLHSHLCSSGERVREGSDVTNSAPKS